MVLVGKNISEFGEGSYTGEVPARSLTGMVDYTIIGHSERRKYFNESNEIIKKKIDLAKKYNIEPILCVRDKKDFSSPAVKYIAYEPPHSIGTGNNESLENILMVKKGLNLSSEITFLYGGSVNQTNIKSYLSSEEIKGFLVGTASNNPVDFYNLIALS